MLRDQTLLHFQTAHCVSQGRLGLQLGRSRQVGVRCVMLGGTLLLMGFLTRRLAPIAGKAHTSQAPGHSQVQIVSCVLLGPIKRAQACRVYLNAQIVVLDNSRAGLG